MSSTVEIDCNIKLSQKMLVLLVDSVNRQWHSILDSASKSMYQEVIDIETVEEMRELWKRIEYLGDTGLSIFNEGTEDIVLRD